MLRWAKLTDAEYVLRQVAGGLEGYYLGSGEAPGVWSGRLAARLGLAGVVEGDLLRALIDRRHPVGGETLMAGTGRKPMVRAIDATFSAPKSVSWLWAFGGSEVASVISIAHVEAVEAALAFVEERAAVTRRQRNGVRVRARTIGWAVATFLHRTSRSGDPQLHTHAVIANLVQRDDGRWVSLDATALYHLSVLGQRRARRRPYATATPSHMGAGFQAARQTVIDQIETVTDRPGPSQPGQEGQRIDDPMRALADLDRSIRQAAERPDVQLVEPAIPKRQHRMDPWPNIHEQHIAYQHLHPSGQPSTMRQHEVHTHCSGLHRRSTSSASATISPRGRPHSVFVRQTGADRTDSDDEGVSSSRTAGAASWPGCARSAR